MTIVLGILGGIGSGKSTVSRILSQAGARVLDADRIAHAVLDRPEIRRQVADLFGADLLGDDGKIVRSKLAARVFGPGEAAALERLNGIIHPEVRKDLEHAIDQGRRDGVPVIVLDVPLLLESSLDRLCDRLLFVKVQEPIRRARCAARGWDEAEFDRREARQRPVIEKEAAADFVVANDDDIGALEAGTRAVYRTLTGQFGGTDG